MWSYYDVELTRIDDEITIHKLLFINSQIINIGQYVDWLKEENCFEYTLVLNEIGFELYQTEGFKQN